MYTRTPGTVCFRILACDHESAAVIPNDNAAALLEAEFDVLMKDFKKYSKRLLEDKLEISRIIERYCYLIEYLVGDKIDHKEAVLQLKTLKIK